MVAFDTDTGQRLSEADAEAAANNPDIWSWVEWRPLDKQPLKG